MRPIRSLLEGRLELERHEKGWRVSAIGLPAIAASFGSSRSSVSTSLRRCCASATRPRRTNCPFPRVWQHDCRHLSPSSAVTSAAEKPTGMVRRGPLLGFCPMFDLKKKPIAAPPDDDATQVGDVFDNLDALRVDQSYGSGLKTRKPFTQCPIRKPRAHEWFRVSRDLVIETELFEHKEEMSAEWYLAVGPVVKAELEGKYLNRVRIYTWINRKGALHIWPVKLPDREGKTNDWNTSSDEACKTAQDHWTTIENTGGGWQAVVAENDQLSDPEWPPHTMNQILRVAFKGGKVVEDLEHPLFDRLRGRVV